MDPNVKHARAIVLAPNWRRSIANKLRGSEHLHFLAEWFKRPRQTASVVPSSRHLADLMVRGIDSRGGPVIELGGGTGVFTRAILETGLPANQLEVVEINPAFARNLRRRFAGVSIVEVPAQHISGYVAHAAGDYQTVVSGLPLLAMDKKTNIAILREAFALLAPGGVFVQFTYSIRSPVGRDVLDALGLESFRIGQTVRNFPPATVFGFRRKGE